MDSRRRDRTQALRPIAHALAVAAYITLVSAPAPSSATEYPSIFFSRETRSTDLSHFPKWQGMLDRFAVERIAAADCTEDDSSACPLRRWMTRLDELRGLDRLAQIRAINRDLNKRRYVLDQRNWGTRDHWATPLEFLRKNGDCEDFAIAKFMSLRALGVPNRDMRIVVLQDLKRDLPHAVLVVYLHGTAYVLDNQIKQVVRADELPHYKAIYSINEDSWWRHSPDEFIGAALSS